MPKNDIELFTKNVVTEVNKDPHLDHVQITGNISICYSKSRTENTEFVAFVGKNKLKIECQRAILEKNIPSFNPDEYSL